MSRLGRLFKYAKSSGSEELENFSTEALATAIEADPRPWLSAMRQRKLLPPEAADEALVVHTQVGESSRTGGRLCLDLVVAFEAPAGRSPWWVEVKVNAGEHGQQLTEYQARAGTLPHHPTVITLARSSQVKEGVPGITWRDLADSCPVDAHPHWQELCAFMEEKRMILNAEDPIESDDIQALTRTIETLDKMTERLHRFAKKAAAAPTKVAFQQNKGPIRRILGSELGRYRRLTLPFQGGVAGLLVGLRWFGQGPKKEARLLLCVEHNPKQDLLRTQLIETAEKQGLAKSWERSHGGWPALEKSAPIADPKHSTVDGSVDWWLEGLGELEKAGILEMLSKTPSRETLDKAGDDGGDDGEA